MQPGRNGGTCADDRYGSKTRVLSQHAATAEVTCIPLLLGGSSMTLCPFPCCGRQHDTSVRASETGLAAGVCVCARSLYQSPRV